MPPLPQCGTLRFSPNFLPAHGSLSFSVPYFEIGPSREPTAAAAWEGYDPEHLPPVAEHPADSEMSERQHVQPIPWRYSSPSVTRDQSEEVEQ